MSQEDVALWKVVHCFGEDAIGPALGSDLQALVPWAEIVRIADRSSIAYFTDGQQLWADEHSTTNRPGIRRLSARAALDGFGVERLYDAREYGSS